jgi:hypothetical protein
MGLSNPETIACINSRLDTRREFQLIKEEICMTEFLHYLHICI